MNISTTVAGVRQFLWQRKSSYKTIFQLLGLSPLISSHFLQDVASPLTGSVPLHLPSHPPKSSTTKGAEIINFCQIGNVIDWLFGASIQSKSFGKIVYQINTWEHLCSDGKTFNLMNSPFTGGSSFINILIRFPSWIYLFFFKSSTLYLGGYGIIIEINLLGRAQ